MKQESITHPFAPIFDANSKILILGTMPSVKSRETQFYYGHPRNRFYAVLAQLLNQEIPQTNEKKKKFLLKNGIAVYDVLESCEISGSADSSIQNAQPSDLSPIFEQANILAVFANGAAAAKLYEKHQAPKYGQSCIALPSTSPANAAASIEKLIEKWSVLLPYLI